MALSFAEDSDLIALSMSTSHIEAPTLHTRSASCQAPAPRRGGGEDWDGAWTGCRTWKTRTARRRR